MYLKICISFSLLLFATFPLIAQNNWQLKTEQDGIRVYQATVPGSFVKAIKVECEFASTPAILAAVLLDVKACPEWVYHTKSCTLVKQVSPMELYYYSEVILPWPVENRDFVAHLTVSENPKTHVVTVDGPAVPGFVPQKKGLVRIEQSRGQWTITPTDNQRIKVTYVLQVDPGGNVPAWLINLFAAEGPIHSFKSLKIQLKKPRYQDAKLPF